MVITRQQTFLTGNGIRPARGGPRGGSQQGHLLCVRKGVAEPTRPVLIAVAATCSRIQQRSLRGQAGATRGTSNVNRHQGAEPYDEA